MALALGTFPPNNGTTTLALAVVSVVMAFLRVKPVAAAVVIVVIGRVGEPWVV
jgi:hypothetical protein